MLVVGCSKAVSGVCYPEAKDCIFVDGPSNATVNYVSEVVVLDAMFYHIQVSWEVRLKIKHPRLRIATHLHATALHLNIDGSPN